MSFTHHAMGERLRHHSFSVRFRFNPDGNSVNCTYVLAVDLRPHPSMITGYQYHVTYKSGIILKYLWFMKKMHQGVHGLYFEQDYWKIVRCTCLGTW